jgi:hypothetical protein
MCSIPATNTDLARVEVAFNLHERLSPGLRGEMPAFEKGKPVDAEPYRKPVIPKGTSPRRAKTPITQGISRATGFSRWRTTVENPSRIFQTRLKLPPLRCQRKPSPLEDVSTAPSDSRHYTQVILPFLIRLRNRYHSLEGTYSLALPYGGMAT